MKNLLTAVCCAVSFSAGAQLSLVKDIAPGTDHAHPVSLSIFKNKLYFLAHNGNAANGSVELWSHDAATNATAMVADINPQTSLPTMYGYWQTCVVGNELYFSANDNVHNIELWKYDGNSAPVMVKDIAPGSLAGDPRYMTELNGKLYFSADNGTAGSEMHCYDPATGTLTMLKDICPGIEGGSTSKSVVYNGKLYFPAKDVPNGTRQLWMHDPVAKTTTKITNGLPLKELVNLYVFNNKLYFAGTEAGEGAELCSYDGATIKRAVNLAPGANDGIMHLGIPNAMVAFKNKLHFIGGVAGSVAAYDPNAGTTTDVLPPPSAQVSATNLFVYAGKMYFSGVHGTPTAGIELQRWDGTKPPELVVDIRSGGTSSNPASMIIYDNHLYFTAQKDPEGRELFKFYDSDVTSVSPVKFTAMINVYPNPSSSIFSMDMNLEQPATFAVQVYDMAGRKVYDGGVHSYENGKHQLSVPAEGLAPGNYTLQLRTSSEAFYTTQLVKQ